ncbi:RHS repeat-associated core domain-containing protein [Gilliamella apicola]|uniref:RHS repeat-associated core domain-containing protein n=1 Tax=Gilliamella apicola TaxID=1196095 RepID=UPI0015E8A18D|nr:RHS repeat-associated core domain-containing protein [Gilliamella apicola]
MQVAFDIYGRIWEDNFNNKHFLPFRFQGQYYDSEIDLCYQRHRYYDPNIGNFISQDPIGLAGGNPTMYGYVKDSNTWIDPFGLDVYGLYTTADGWYPVHTKGQPQPTSYVFMKKDELYKIGESKNSANRYSTIALDEARINKSGAKSVGVDANGKVIQGQTAGLRMDFFDQGGTKQADRLLENQLLEDYKKQNGGNLPAGNKTCH